MKSIVSFSQIKTLVTCLVAVSLAGQQIVFADVRALLPQAKTGKQAVAVIELAESRPLSTYFQDGGSTAEITRLDADMKTLATANTLVGIADDLDKFELWWSTNKTSILLTRAKLQSSNLEGFFTQVFIKFKAEETRAEKDPNAFIEWLSSKVTNPAVRFASYSSFVILVGTLAYAVGLVKGALVAGPAASILSALVEPIVRPIREKATMIGSRSWIGKLGSNLAITLFKNRQNAASAIGDLNHLSTQIASAREGALEAHELMKTMGYDMNSADFTANMAKFHTIWNKTNQVWVQTNPSLFRDGRDVFSNAIALKPQTYSGQIMQSLQGAEQARQNIEQHIDRIISRTGQNAQVVEESVVRLLRAVEMNENAKEANQISAKDGLAEPKEALKALGATSYQVGRIIESRLSELVYVRHTAYTLAANVIHELQYEEYNRTLPEEVQTIQRSLRDGTCLDYFHNEFSGQVSKILNEMDIRLSAAEKVVDAAKESPQLKLVRPEPPKALDETSRKGVSKYLRDRASRATSALSRLNSMGQNRAAIERTGTLRGENSDTLEARAKEAVKAVGKK